MGDRLHTLITDFTSGELSPRWQARVAGGSVATPLGTSASLADIYRSGCKEMTNVLALPQGGAALRLGTKFGAYTDTSFDAVVGEGDNYRLTTFRLDGVNDVVLLWRPLEVKVYNPDGMLLIQTITTPYANDDLPGLAFTQSRTELVILSSSYRPRILQISGFSFSLTDSVDRLVPPLFNFRDPSGSVRAPVIIVKDYTITFGANAQQGPWFWFNISRQPRDTDTIAVTDEVDDAVTREQLLKAIGDNRGVMKDTVTVNITAPRTFVVTYEYWGPVGDGSGDLAIYPDNGTDEFTLVDNNEDGTTSQSAAEPLWSGPLYTLRGGTYYQCVVSHRSADDNEPGVGANWTDYWVDRGVSAPTEDVDLIVWFKNQAYYPRDRGWPTLGTFHEQRLVMNGPPSVPHALAAGRITQLEYLDFTLGSDPDDGILLLVANESGLSIKWFLSQRRLFIGTSRGVYIQTEIPFTATSVSLERHSMLRSARLDPLPVNGELMYFQGNFRQVRKVQYVQDLEMWEGRDVTLFAEHLFKEDQPVRDWTYHDEVDSVIWAAREDGLLLSMTYDSIYDVAAWGKHNVGAPVRSVETVHVLNKETLVMIVKRMVWDSTAQAMRVRPTIELLESTSQNMYSVSPDFNDSSVPGRHLDGAQWTPHLDSYEEVVGDGTSTITLPRFASQLVRVVENGVILSTVVATPTGVIQLDTKTTVGATVRVGRPYVGRLVPNRIQFMTRDGTSQSQKVRWTKPVMRLFASTMPLMNGERPRERKQTDNYDRESELFSGDVDIVNLGTDTDLTIEIDQSLPCHVTGIFGLLTTEEG